MGGDGVEEMSERKFLMKEERDGVNEGVKEGRERGDMKEGEGNKGGVGVGEGEIEGRG